MRTPTEPSSLLRVDGVAVAGIAVLLYRELGLSWWWFLLGFLVPDLALLAYLAGRRSGALIYNLAHTYGWGTLALGSGLVMQSAPLIAVGCVWIAHVGIDRALGLGLKYEENPRATHLQRV